MIHILIILGTFALDRLSKVLAQTYLAPKGSVPLIKDALHLSYHTNTGAAFSIFKEHTFYLSIISILAVIVFGVYLYTDLSKNGTSLLSISLAMIIGGTIGNFYDRFFNGYVVDFIDFRLINFAVFNLADSFITVGAILMIIYVLFLEKK